MKFHHALAVGASLMFVCPEFVDASERTQTIHIHLSDHAITPHIVKVPLNKPIHIVVQNDGRQIHEFAIPEFRIYTRNLMKGETSDIQFEPWEKGTFQMSSDPDGSTNPEYLGTFEVK